MAEETKINSWLEVKPTLTKNFIAEKNRCFGNFGEVVDGTPLTRFCGYALGINEPVILKYGIGLLITTSGTPYSRHARIHPLIQHSSTLAYFLYIFLE